MAWSKWWAKWWVGRALCNILQKFIMLGLICILLVFYQPSHVGPVTTWLKTIDTSLIGFVMLSVFEPEGFEFLLIGAIDGGRCRCRYYVSFWVISPNIHFVADDAGVTGVPLGPSKTPLALASFPPNFPFPCVTATAESQTIAVTT